MKMGGLKVHDLVKQLGDNLVINGISFQVEEEEFFVLLGPSGGGKSTTLRLICGLEMPDRGRIIIDGRDVTTLPPRARNLGMVFQDYGLYPHMNVFKNISYGLEARGGYSRSEIDKQVREAAQKLMIADMLERAVVDLSGGEQQRVALARALAKNADAYLFDEPLSNLDPKLRYQARRDILIVHRMKGKPSIYVTHDQTEAFAIADRIGLLANGQLQQVGTADELLSEPANLFVARFVGSPPMNLLPARIVREGDARYRVQADGLALTLSVKWHPTLSTYGKEKVIVGIRPGAMAQEGKPSEFEVNPENTIVANLEDIQPLIGETIVTLKVGSQTWLAAAFQETDEALAPGDALNVGVDVDQIRLFDPDTEQALTEA
jgi:ABC-type sugar transport system ATPase subunit